MTHMTYQYFQAHADALWPLRTLAKVAIPDLSEETLARATWPALRRIIAANEVMKLTEITHHRPPFGITSVTIAGRSVAVEEQVAHCTPFGTLLHFAKEIPATQPRVLIAAPMSGHFATLLRETVRSALVDHDVYITDWHNGRSIPVDAGRFGFDEYIEHLMEFMHVLGPGAHLMAICQPCVAALAAVAVMAEAGDADTPSSLTLMAGPIDCRISPTEVNKLATSRPIEWFEQHLISSVPAQHRGARRRVYPGFVQLAAFLNMNLERHINSFRDYYDDIVNGDWKKANAKRAFYEEYFAVADLPAEFYLETVRLVFQEYALPLGKLQWHGRRVDPAAIRRTALLTVEGERDDICALGQTLAAQDLCVNVRQFMRTHYVQPGVGHYGVFSGQRWKSNIYPIVRDVIHSSG